MSMTAFAFEASLVDFMATHVWHRLRPLFSSHLSRRCRRCLLSEAFTPLNEKQICAECLNHKPTSTTQASNHSQKNKEELQMLATAAAGKGPYGYDALVLVSGGKDSAYMLHKLKSEHPKLRLITFLVDNGFMSPFALQNAQNLVAKFNEPHVTWRSRPSFVRKTFVEMLTHLDRQTGYSIVDLADGLMTFNAARIFAAEKKIPLVFCGLGRIQTEQVFRLSGIELPLSDEVSALENYLKIDVDKLYTDDEKLGWYKCLARGYDVQPKFILPFLAWDPTETEVLESVQKLDLISKKQSRPLLTNNRLIPLIGMAEYAKFGYSCFEVEFARMVREGKSERQYWLNLFEMLEYSAKTGRFINKSLKETLQQLGLKGSDLSLRTR